MEAVQRELAALRATSDDAEVVALVLDAHRQLLSDELLFQAALDRIEMERTSAAWALSCTAANARRASRGR